MRRVSPAMWAGAAVLLLQLPLHAGWMADPAGVMLANPFHGVHGWAGQVVGDAWAAGRWPSPTSAAGFPLDNRARFIGWAFLVPAALLRSAVSPLVVVHVAAWVGPALGAAAMVPLIARISPDASARGRVAGAVLYGLAPVTLGAAASGQVENAQSWVVPLLLIAAWEAGRRPRLIPAIPLIWGFGALTSPYLAMMAGLAAPWVVWRGPRWGGLASLAAGALGLVGARAAFAPGDFDAARDVFRPNFGYDGWPDLWSTPLPVADLDTLLLGPIEPQVRTMVVHQPYLGLALLVGALALGRERRAWAAPVVVGVVLALGPVLAWQQAPLRLFGHALALPAVALRWVDFPLAHGGQYYRAAILAHLGLAGMLATARAPRAALVVGVVGALDALRSVAAPGLPWPVEPLPVAAWQAWADDPIPGAVVHVPQFSEHLTPNHPARLAGRTVHGRDMAAMPRSTAAPPRVQALQVLHACTVRGAACPPPDLETLGGLGFRFVALDLAATPERVSLRGRLVALWGEPDGQADGVEWWTVPGAR